MTKLIHLVQDLILLALCLGVLLACVPGALAILWLAKLLWEYVK